MPAPIVVTGTVVGAERVVTSLGVTQPAAAVERVRNAVHRLGYLLEAKVKTDKLNGGVLNRRSGRLARSINTQFTSSGLSETASVGTSVLYGRIWELTGSREFVIVPKTKKALFWKGAAHPVRSVLHPAQAPRPFLRPALDDMRPLIRTTIADAARGA